MNWTFFDKSNPLPMADFTADIEFPPDTTFGAEVFGHIGKSVSDLTPTGTSVMWNPGSGQIIDSRRVTCRVRLTVVAWGCSPYVPGVGDDLCECQEGRGVLCAAAEGATA